MALDSTDVFVLQRATDTQPHFKLSLGELSNYIEASDTVQFRGARDFTNGAEDPNGDGTGRIHGDMYVNNGAGVDQANGWADMDGVVSTGDRAIWDGNLAKWELIRSSADSGGTLVEIRKTDPITVDGVDDPTRPIVGIRQATKGNDPDANSGAVARLATDEEVAKDGTGGTDAVVTADQLRATNIAVDAAAGGGLLSVIGVDPIDVAVDGSNGSSTSSPAVSVKEASTTQIGVSEFVTQDEVDNATSGYDTKVVTGDLLKATNDAVAGITPGIQAISSVNTIDVTGDTDNTVLEVKPNIFLPFSFVDLPEEGDL
jgi:hypothetical protein